MSFSPARRKKIARLAKNKCAYISARVVEVYYQVQVPIYTPRSRASRGSIILSRSGCKKPQLPVTREGIPLLFLGDWPDRRMRAF